MKPERPAALDQPPSVEGAVAVAEYFLALYPYAYATGDLADWQALSDEACVFCASVVSNVKAMQALGHTRTESATIVHGAVGAEIETAAFFTVDVDAKQGDQTEVDSVGATVQTTPGGEFSLLFGVEWAGAWAVREVDVTPAAP